MNRVLAALLVVSLSIDIFLAVFIYQLLTGKKFTTVVGPQIQEEKLDREYPLLARRIFLESPNDTIINFIPLRTQLREYTQEIGGKIAVYFEYLPTGVNIGINERLPFRRASLVKIPLVMQIYRAIEEKKLSKETVLTITEDDLDANYGNLWKQGAGATVTVEQAIDLALTHSDNTAFNLLQRALTRIRMERTGDEDVDNNIDYIYDYLDIERSPDSKTITISAKGFSSILKSLYFSAYLNYEDSNEIITTLTRTISPYKLLPSGLPDRVAIAHKYGVNRDGTNKNIVTSDCGIVYVPHRQYVICVMVADQPEVAAQYFTDIAKMTYEYVSGQKGGN